MNGHRDGAESEALHDAFEAMLADAGEPVFPSVTDAAVAGGRRIRRRRRAAVAAAAAVLVAAVLTVTTTVGLPDRAPNNPAEPPAPTGSTSPTPSRPLPTPSEFSTDAPTGAPSVETTHGTEATGGISSEVPHSPVGRSPSGSSDSPLETVAPN